MQLRNILEQHHYPAWLLRNPRLIHIHFLVLKMLFRRSRICTREIRRLLDSSQNASASILDGGCGEGQFLLPMIRHYRTFNFTGIDALPTHIHFLNAWKKKTGSPNCKFVHEDLEKHLTTTLAYDFIFLISVLQYTKDPARIIRLSYEGQPPGGTLLLYSPVNPGYHYKFYHFIRKKYGHYDEAQSLYHPMTAMQLREWIQKAGYQVVYEERHYGPMATLGHEIMQSLLILITHWPGATKIIPGLLFIILAPIFVSLQFAETWFRPEQMERSNGILLILKK